MKQEVFFLILKKYLFFFILYLREESRILGDFADDCSTKDYKDLKIRIPRFLIGASGKF